MQAFCAPCGDARATAIEVRDLGIARVWDGAGSASVRRRQRPYLLEIELNGAGIDLAYVYVRTPAGWGEPRAGPGPDATGVPRTLPAESLPR